MKHSAPKKGTSKTSFVQAVLLIVFLVLGYLGYSVLKKGGGTAGLNSFVNMEVEDFRALKSMKEEQKHALQKTFGGFWVYSTADTFAPVRKEERLELRDNGIIWQVIRWQVAYPDEDTVFYYQIRHGYLNPYSVAADGRSIVCEVRTIRQVFMQNDDTCFGQSQVDELWQARIDGSLLVMNRKRYQQYHGELSLFFPGGMIDLIDELIMNDCRHGINLGGVVREQLRECFQKSEWTRTCDASYMGQLVNDYFKVCIMDELFSTIPYFPSLPAQIELPLVLQHDGTALLDMPKAKRTQAGHFTALIYNGIENWPFPRCDAAAMPHIRVEVTLPLP